MLFLHFCEQIYAPSFGFFTYKDWYPSASGDAHQMPPKKCMHTKHRRKWYK